MAGKHSRTGECNRTRGDFISRPSVTAFDQGPPHSYRAWAQSRAKPNSGRGPAEAHRHDTEADTVGSFRSKGRGNTFGTTSCNSLLPHEEAWDSSPRNRTLELRNHIQNRASRPIGNSTLSQSSKTTWAAGRLPIGADALLKIGA